MGEPRFFIDHGTIHDRMTGRHVRTDPDYGPGRKFEEDGIEECCELLNRLDFQASYDNDASELEAAKAQIAELTRERDDARDMTAAYKDCCDHHEAEVESARSRLTTAVEALEWCEQAGFTILHEQVRNIARKALAAIKGDSCE